MLLRFLQRLVIAPRRHDNRALPRLEVLEDRLCPSGWLDFTSFHWHGGYGQAVVARFNVQGPTVSFDLSDARLATARNQSQDSRNSQATSPIRDGTATANNNLAFAAIALTGATTSEANGLLPARTEFPLTDASQETIATASSKGRSIYLLSGSGEERGSIGGFMFRDDNDNGEPDVDEPALDVQMVVLESIDTDGRSAVVSTTMSSARGEYGFSGLLPGTYKVRARLGKDLRSTIPSGKDAAHEVTLDRSSLMMRRNFGAISTINSVAQPIVKPATPAAKPAVQEKEQGDGKPSGRSAELPPEPQSLLEETLLAGDQSSNTEMPDQLAMLVRTDSSEETEMAPAGLDAMLLCLVLASQAPLNGWGKGNEFDGRKTTLSRAG